MFFYAVTVLLFLYWLWTLPFEPRFYGEGSVVRAWNLVESEEEK
jgi:hypothetical protein